MPRGRIRQSGEGRVDKQTAYEMGRSDFSAGRLPLPSSNTPADLEDYYEGYEVEQGGAEYPGLGRWGRGN